MKYNDLLLLYRNEQQLLLKNIFLIMIIYFIFINIKTYLIYLLGIKILYEFFIANYY